MKEKKLNICMESAVSLMVNSEKIITFMCTPFDLEELAIGHLHSRGVIKNLSEVIGSGVCSENKKVTIVLDKKIELKDVESYLPNILLTSCGSGSTYNEDKIEGEFLNVEKTFRLDEVKSSFGILLENAVIYKKTGGMHCALINVNGENFIREDIGRHNAVDKAIGATLKSEKNLKESFIISTGRISVDMVLKAASAKIPVVASRSIASDLAIEVAEKIGITLIGRVNTLEPIIYTIKERIK